MVCDCVIVTFPDFFLIQIFEQRFCHCFLFYKTHLYFRTVYVAEWGGKRLIGYQRKPNNDLTQMWVSSCLLKKVLYGHLISHSYVTV